MDRSQWLLVAHVVVFAIWFGTDLATFTLSRRVVSPTTTPQIRAAVAGGMMSVEIFARLCLPLAIGSGVLTAEDRGWIDWGWISGAVGIAAPLWSIAVWVIHASGPRIARRVASVDLIWRIAVAATLWVLAIWSLAANPDGPVSTRWLAVKLLCAAVIVSSGIAIRFLLRPFNTAFAEVLADGSSPEREATIADSIRRAQPFVVLIWAGLLVAATMGIAQPVL